MRKRQRDGGRRRGIGLAALACATALAASVRADSAPGISAPARAVDFATEVRPILSKRCFSCHGPDAQHRKAGLRLDTEMGARADHAGTRAIVPGKPDDSAAFARITTGDPDDRMPPLATGGALPPAEVAVLRAWIAQGAPWSVHWSLRPLARPPVPVVAAPPTEVGSTRTVKGNPIDAFVQARLAREGLRPAPPADPYTLVRRLSFDLTGLPPTPEEADAFADDPSAAAYEALVDRLLASPAYGERWARVWLDLARYADSRGYEKDRVRTIWRYRDWVVDAFNRDMAYPQFTVEQLAGDLLPGATREQVLATAFHRNTLTNDEGGTDDEEFRVAAVKDRVDTTLQVWMGLTAGCAKCHDHKYDPLSTSEYYRLYAFFNETEDADRADDGPVAPFPTAAQEQALAQSAARAGAVERRLTRSGARFAVERRRWESSWRRRFKAMLGPSAPIPAKLGAWEQAGPFIVGPDEDPLRRRFAPEEALSGALPVPPGTMWKKAELADGGLWEATAPGEGAAHYLARTIEVDGPRTLRFALAGKGALRIWLDGAPVVEGGLPSELPLELASGMHHLVVKIAGTRRLALTTRLTDERVGELPLSVAQALHVAEARRTPEQRRIVRDHHLRIVDSAARALVLAAESERAALARLRGEIPLVPIVRELPAGKRRETHLQMRGSFLSKGEPLTPGTPAALHPLPPGAPLDRLGLARWLVDPANPLTARVAANRVWAQLFGVGLVETEEDFGSQGAPPSDPALLDWLASEFVARGWSWKALCKTIVMSATYRRDARATKQTLARDPRNRLLARGPRVRLEAEMVRDAALAAAGLLSRKLHGPSVMPPQPPGIWSSVYNANRWVTSTGEDRYRRGLYVFVRRSSPYPSLTTFDAPSREVCSVRRIRSNTPLQALVTLNDPVYVEAAQALAARAARHGGPAPEAAIRRVLRLALVRPAREAEVKTLVALHAERLRRFAGDAKAARLFAGLAPPASDEAAARAAALTAVAQVVLNLDEFLTKE